MAGWDIYQQRMQTKRDMWLRRDQQSILRRNPDTLSWHVVTVDGNQQELSIISQTEHNTKRICAMPGETLPHGALVEYAGAVWLITEVDSETEVYHRGIMLRCNHKLRWINREGAIVEKWCVVEDGVNGEFTGKVTATELYIGDQTGDEYFDGLFDDTYHIWNSHHLGRPTCGLSTNPMTAVFLR